MSRSTVDLAYEQLISEGYIEAVPCKGYFVLQIDELFQFVKKEVGAAKEPDIKKQKYEFDFTPSGIDLKKFPIVQCMEKIIERCPAG